MNKDIQYLSEQEAIELVPQTYGEAIQKYPFIACEGHEWDNRTTIENAFYLIQQFNNLSEFIPATEQTPDVGQQVLGYNNDNGSYYTGWYFKQNQDSISIKTDVTNENLQDNTFNETAIITHWLPRPNFN